ncbi:hypothetical protein NESM_000039800 [Novymonas esmeraldas]|uniref:Uncharacterized protein n=1 Tax=Novymonas esmeraldas TaxID=1808958 RepID=A0AAW0F165_9TRYP
MYPGLPRWSDGSSGGTAASSGHRAVPVAATTAVPPNRGTTESGGYVITPALVHAAPPLAQAIKTSRSGRAFVNHNAPASVPLGGAAAPPPLAATAVPTAGVVPGPSTRAHAGQRQQSAQPSLRMGAYDGADGRLAAAASPPFVPGRLTHGTDRRGLIRGTTVAAPGDAQRESASGLSLEVEGVQTGEGVLVDATPARRRSTTGATPNSSHDAAQQTQLRRQLEKAVADLKAATTASRRQKQEHQQQRAEWLLLLREAEARLRVVETNQVARERLFCRELGDAIKKLLDAAASQAEMARVAALAHANERNSWEAERSALVGELQAAQAALAAQTPSASPVEVETGALEQLRAELAALQQSTAERQRSLEVRLAEVQTTLQTAEAELRRYRQERDQSGFLVAQCRLFIQQVCQPGFSVVKGPSLEPVEKDRPEPTGYVLVPLAVLLHGYALLPEGDRQAVIDHYDAKGKSL